MRTTQQIRNAWAPPCQIQKATFAFWNGVEVTVDARVVPALRVLDSCLKRWKYAPRVGETWGYNCRRITGGSGYSLHSYGVAIDVNSRANPYGKRLITDMPRDMVAAIKSIRTKGGHQVWRWGGDYSGNKDAMHFEIVASPAELATGIVQPKLPTPHPEPAEQRPQEDPMPVAFQYGDDLDTFTVEDGKIITRFYQPKGWSKLELADGARPDAQVAVVRDYRQEKGRLDVFAEGTAGLVHAWYSGGAWHNEVLV